MMVSNVVSLAQTSFSSKPVIGGEAAKATGGAGAIKGIGEFIKEVAEGQEKMAGAMREALSGRKLSGTEMLAVQAGIYRYSAELDLAARLVEKLSSGVKQAMNTQVG